MFLFVLEHDPNSTSSRNCSSQMSGIRTFKKIFIPCCLSIKMSIYEPREDSYLLSDTLKEYLKKISDKNIKILDMGSGSGIHAEICRELGFEDILTADINPDSVKLLKSKGFKSINTDLFSRINREQRFDLIIFNPPYLPEDKREPLDSSLQTCGGKMGYEIILKFLEESKNFLKKKGKIILLFSSLSEPEVILSRALQIRYKIKLLKKQKLFFEELYVYELGLGKI